jgi:hypothetical protein
VNTLLNTRRYKCARLSLLFVLLLAASGLFLHENAVDRKESSSCRSNLMMDGAYQRVAYLKNRSASGTEAMIVMTRAGSAAWVERSNSAGRQVGELDVNVWSEFWAQLEAVGAFSLEEGGAVAESTNSYHSIIISDSRKVRYGYLYFNDGTLVSNFNYRLICNAIDIVLEQAKWSPLTFSNKMDRFLYPIGPSP